MVPDPQPRPRPAGALKIGTVAGSDVLVSSYQTGGSTHADDLPTDQISFNFGKIEMEYRPQNPDGSLDQPVMGGWDVQHNQPV